MQHRPRVRREVLVLGAQSHLDRVAVEAHLLLRQRQGLALRHAQLPFDQVQPGHRLGHRVLHLQPRVHLHQVEVARPRAGTPPSPRPHSPPPAPAPRRSAPMRLAQAASTAGLGVSSMSFWCRRCTEQSRSPRWMQWPCASANTCTSTWRGASSARSSSSSPEPKADLRLGSRAVQRSQRAARPASRGACRARRRPPRP